MSDYNWMNDVVAFAERENVFVCIESPYKDTTWRCSISHRGDEVFTPRSVSVDAASPEEAWNKASEEYERLVEREEAMTRN